MKHLLLLILCSLFIGDLYGQAIEENITVQYMKANVLFDSGRFDEAVRMYNRILAEDENYVMALWMRARAKYELGAYRGTKNDVIRFIEKNGVNKDILRLMIRTEWRLSNFRAARNYVATAIEMDKYDGELYFLAGEIASEVGDKNEACENYAKGAQLDHERSRARLDENCYGLVLSMQQTKVKETDQVQPTSDVDDTYLDQEALEAGRDMEEEIEDEEELDPEDLVMEPEEDIAPEEGKDETGVDNMDIPPVDIEARQEVEIDEKLSLTISNGLGARNIESAPNIFMLSTQDGVVVIDICVDSDGKVISTEFNRPRSTLLRSSLISLAIRKSREFMFFPSLRNEQCGSVEFNIKS